MSPAATATGKTGAGCASRPTSSEPDKLLAGLTARQLAILAVAAVALWAGYAATRHLVPPAAYGARRRPRRSRSRPCWPSAASKASPPTGG